MRRIILIAQLKTFLRPRNGACDGFVAFCCAATLCSPTAKPSALLAVRAFVVADGKLAENTGDIFDAISRKELAVGFYDGTILPIDLIGLDPKPFIACVAQSLSQREKLHWR
jgi:hypothetical protein